MVERYVVVSTDSHIGPEVEAYADYCEPTLREDFAAFVAQTRAAVEFVPGAEGWKPSQDDEMAQRHAEDEGVNDPAARLANMDADGVAAEVLFHGIGSYRRFRGHIPFVGAAIGARNGTGWSREHQAAGKRMYNRWLVDFCSAAPQRLLGIAELPSWDIEASVREVEWAAEAGMAGLNFAAPRGSMPTYDDPVWEPFWSAVEDADLSLNCHSGTGLHEFPGAGVAWRALYWSEIHFVGHMPLSMMIFGGVFERHPRLRVIFNEQRGHWVRQALRDLDAIYQNPWSRLLREEIPERPSTYWRRHCFLGGSFLAHFELEQRHEIGVETITWGRDYPHIEGTWPFTAESLRAALHDLPEDEVRVILGDSGIRCYNLDAAELGRIAAGIGPRPAAVAEPLDRVPAEAWGWAFRDMETAKGGARFGGY